MNTMLPPNEPVLQVRYVDNILDKSGDNPILANIYRSGSEFVVDCSVEDISIDLRTLIDTAPYLKSDDDLTALRSMAKHLTNGVNKYSRQDFRIIRKP